jgi:hypothetical protein
MLWLLGPATAVTAHLDWVELPKGRTDAGFAIALQHAGGVQSYVEPTKINRLAARELRAYGSIGSYRSYGTDVAGAVDLCGTPAGVRTGNVGLRTREKLGDPRHRRRRPTRPFRAGPLSGPIHAVRGGSPG